jgi:hypothetical protein
MTMLKPPFKLATMTGSTTSGFVSEAAHLAAACCEGDDRSVDAATPQLRVRLTDMPQHLHCSVIGTCLSTAELRKLMARFLFVRDSSDLDVHHEAVSHASQSGPVAKALQKLLDQRHEVAVQRFGRAHDSVAIAELWDEALKQGEIPGAYWAVLTHRHATAALRQKVFGDVHMLSHLVGAANRADIRRLVALERDNDELRERAERQQLRFQETLDERDRMLAALQQELTASRSGRAIVSVPADARLTATTSELADAMSLVAVQTERRERAEQAAGVASEEASRLREELDHLARHVQTLNQELLAAETQLREIGEGSDTPGRSLALQLHGRRVFYVGGRPSSTPAIRDLVLRHGGEFQHHDGGLEDRKGLLAAGVAGAQLVVFPVDCIDHDSAGNLKRLCTRQGIAYLPLRRASVASFAAALADSHGNDAGPSEPPGCMRA